MDNKREDGCECKICGQHYKVDFMISDKLWKQIGQSDGDMICGACIAKEIEKIGEFGAYKLVTTGSVPRRINLLLNTVAEIAIHNAMCEVEKLPADPKLTEAVVLLSEARNIVADYVDEHLA